MKINNDGKCEIKISTFVYTIFDYFINNIMCGIHITYSCTKVQKHNNIKSLKKGPTNSCSDGVKLTAYS